MHTSVRKSGTVLTSTTSGNSSQKTLSLILNARLWEANCLFCREHNKGNHGIQIDSMYYFVHVYA